MFRVSLIGCVIAILAVLVLAPDGRSQSCAPSGAPTIVQVPPTDPPRWCIESAGANSWNITLQRYPDNEQELLRFWIYRTSAADVINSLTIERPLPAVWPKTVNTLAVFLGDIYSANSGFAAASHIEVDPWSVEAPGLVEVQLHYTGMVGEIEGVNKLVGNEVGNVAGPIVCEMHPASPTGGGPHESTIHITSPGSLRGDVIMLPSVGQNPVAGRINRLEFLLGTIGLDSNSDGTPDGAVNIFADSVVEGVEAREIYANIRGTEQGGYDSYVSKIGFFQTITSPGGTGHFNGEIRAVEFGEDVAGYASHIFAGEMRGRIWLQRIPDFSAYYFTIPAQKLLKTISLGVLDPGEGTGAWGRSIDIGSISLDSGDATGYVNPASDLGGGAVGLVPFRLHAGDCFPKQGEKIDPAVFANFILMRHYGPVAWDSSNGQPFKVERRKAGDPNATWYEQGCFTCIPHATNSTIVVVSKGTPSESATGTFQRGFEYRVSLRRLGDNSIILRSDLPHLATADDPEVYDYAPLTFTVCEAGFPSSPGDADDNGIVDDEDADSVLANWGSTACMKYGDADRNNVVNSLDLEAVELYYAQEYCYAQGQGMMLPQGDGFASLGFAEQEAASAAPMTLSQAVAAMGYASVEAFGEEFDAYDDTQRGLVRSVLMALIRGE